MQLLASWKRSLGFFSKSKIQEFFVGLRNSIPTIYSNWLKYGLFSLVLIPIATFVFQRFGYLPYAAELYVVVLSLIGAYIVITLYIIVASALDRQPFSFQSYKNHRLLGIFFLTALFLAALIFSGFYFLMKTTSESHCHLYKKMIDGKNVQKITKLYNELCQFRPTRIITITLLFVMLMETIMLYGALLFFFFLETPGTLRDFFKSILMTLKFILFNIPLLIVMACLIVGGLYLLGYLLNLSYVALYIPIFSVLFIEPLLVVLIGYVYRQYK